MYTEKVKEHFMHPKHSGEIKDADAVGEVGNAACGDIMRVYLKVKDEKIADIKFKTFGCAAAIASSDVLCELAYGKSIEQAMKITNKDIAEYLGGLPAVKLHCSILGAEALHDAIINYKKKKSAK